ncbi:MAG: hypothetical protein C4287_22955 [Leptolyngbya sp. ERB_1_2]
MPRQYSGTAGRSENCPIGLFLAYASERGRTFLERELSLPKEGAEDQERREGAGVSEEVEFATKPELARRMRERALEGGVPAGWVRGDTVSGGDRKLRMWLEERRQALRAGGARQRGALEPHGAGPSPGTSRRARGGGQRGAVAAHECGRGRQGAAALRLGEGPPLQAGGEGWNQALLVRRRISQEKELASYVVFAPAETSLAELVRVAGSRWSIEECLESAKGEGGLDQYEGRRWEGGYRYITLALVAHAYLALLRHQAEEAGGKGGEVG